MVQKRMPHGSAPARDPVVEDRYIDILDLYCGSNPKKFENLQYEKILPYSSRKLFKRIYFLSFLNLKVFNKEKVWICIIIK